MAWLAWLYLLPVILNEDDILLALLLSHSGVSSSLAGLCPPGAIGSAALGGVVPVVGDGQPSGFLQLLYLGDVHLLVVHGELDLLPVQPGLLLLAVQPPTSLGSNQ